MSHPSTSASASIPMFLTSSDPSSSLLSSSHTSALNTSSFPAATPSTSAASSLSHTHSLRSTDSSFFFDVPSEDLAGWKSEWTRINTARRSKTLLPNDDTMTDVIATSVDAATAASVSHITPATSPQRTTSSSINTGLFSSARYRGPTSAAAAAAASSAGPNKSPGISKNSSRMMLAATQQQRKASPVKRKLDMFTDSLGITQSTSSHATYPIPTPTIIHPPTTSSSIDLSATLPSDLITPTTLANGTIVSTYNGVSMIALRPTASSSSHESPSKRTRTDSIRPSPTPKALFMSHQTIIPPPAPPQMPRVSSNKRAYSSPKKDPMFTSAPRRKSLKLVGVATPGLHNSSGIFSYVAGTDTEEDREKRAWMVSEYQQWLEGKKKRSEEIGKKPMRLHTTPIEPSSPPNAMDEDDGEAEIIILPLDAPIDPAPMTPPLLPPRTSRRSSLSLTPRKNSHVRRSLFDELNKSASPSAKGATLARISPVLRDVTGSASAAPTPIVMPVAAAAIATTAAFASSLPIPIHQHPVSRSPPVTPSPVPSAPILFDPLLMPPPPPRPPKQAPHSARAASSSSSSSSLFSFAPQRKIVQAPASTSGTKKVVAVLLNKNIASAKSSSAHRPSATSSRIPSIRSFFAQKQGPTSHLSSQDTHTDEDDDELSPRDELIIVR